MQLYFNYYYCLVWAGMEKTGLLDKIHKLQKNTTELLVFNLTEHIPIHFSWVWIFWPGTI